MYLGALSLLVFYGFAGGVIRRSVPLFIKNLPQLTFEKGKLTAPEKLSYIKLPDGDFKIGFDAARTVAPSNEDLLRQHILLLVTQDTAYMPGAISLQKQPLPPDMTFTTSPEFWSQHQARFIAMLNAVALLAIVFLLPFIFLFDFCLAACVGFAFNVITGKQVSPRDIFCWALFLQGPLAVLWYVHLYCHVPLFAFTQLILCIIYMQQIFNLTPEKNHAH